MPRIFIPDALPGRDITPDLQTAIAAVTEAGGGAIWVPAGRWRCDTQIDVPSNTYLGCPDGHAELLSDGTQGTPLRVVAASNVTLQNLVIAYDGPSETPPPIGLIISYAATDITLSKIRSVGWAHNFAVHGVKPDHRATRIRFDGCHAISARGYGYLVDYADRVTFNDCTAERSELDGFKIRKHSTGVRVNGGSANGNGLHPDHAGDGLDAFSGGDTLELTGFVTSDNHGNGVVIKTGDVDAQGLTGDPQPRRVVMTACVADRNTGTGFTVHRASGPQGDESSWALPETCTLAGCLAEGNGVDGFYIRARSVVLTGCHATANTRAGFRTDVAAFDVDFSACVADGNDSAGQAASFDLSGTRVSVVGGRAVGFKPGGPVSSLDELGNREPGSRFGYYLTGRSTDCQIGMVHASGHAISDSHDIGAGNKWMQ